MIFYTDEDCANEIVKPLKDGDWESHSPYLYKKWDELSPYKIKVTILKKIDKRPFKQKLISMWNNFIKKIFIIS